MINVTVRIYDTETNIGAIAEASANPDIFMALGDADSITDALAIDALGSYAVMRYQKTVEQRKKDLEAASFNGISE